MQNARQIFSISLTGHRRLRQVIGQQSRRYAKTTYRHVSQDVCQKEMPKNARKMCCQV